MGLRIRSGQCEQRQPDRTLRLETAVVRVLPTCMLGGRREWPGSGGAGTGVHQGLPSLGSGLPGSGIAVSLRTCWATICRTPDPSDGGKMVSLSHTTLGRSKGRYDTQVVLESVCPDFEGDSPVMVWGHSLRPSCRGPAEVTRLSEGRNRSWDACVVSRWNPLHASLLHGRRAFMPLHKPDRDSSKENKQDFMESLFPWVTND